MQNLEDLKDKIFFECKNIIESLSKVSSAEEILSKKDLGEELMERISFLKLMERNEDYFATKEGSQSTEYQETNYETAQEEHTQNQEQIEEEVIFTTELNDLHNVEENFGLPTEPEKEKNEEEQGNSKSQQPFDSDKKEEQHPQKFKLSHIKNLKLSKTLFDEEDQEDTTSRGLQTDKGSLEKSNMPKDYMEAEKEKPRFRLDLNDRIAFLQHLFKGNQEEMEKIILQLNHCKDIDKAKEFLSEVYYQKDWKNVDEYAQRLWTLVENKFL